MSRKRSRRAKANPVEPKVSFSLGLLVGLGAGLGIYHLARTQQAVVVEAELPPIPKVKTAPSSGA